VAKGEGSELEGLGTFGDDIAPTCKAVLIEAVSVTGVSTEPGLTRPGSSLLRSASRSSSAA